MAAMTMSAFEPTASMNLLNSTMRASLPPEVPSMADSLPSVNFGFDDLRERMARFTVRFDEFIEKGRKRVLEERNQFRVHVAELNEDQRMKKRDIEIMTLRTSTYSSNLAKESQETAEMHTAIQSLSEQLTERTAHRDALKSQIAEVQKSITARREAQQKHARYLSSQAQHNIPELEFWEENLGLSIEGVGVEDRLKFVFRHICEKEWEREAWFEVAMGRREYEVLDCRPKVERESVERCLEKLNESRHFAAFLKGMRELFVQAMN